MICINVAIQPMDGGNDIPSNILQFARLITILKEYQIRTLFNILSLQVKIITEIIYNLLYNTDIKL